MSWFADETPPHKLVARKAAPRAKSRAGALQDELNMVEAEDAFLVLQAAGRARRDKEVEKIFRSSRTEAEYRKKVLLVAPAVAMKDKVALRVLRQEYRLKHRKPVKPGEGAAPGPAATVSVVPKEVG